MATSQTCCHLPGKMLNSASKCADRARIAATCPYLWAPPCFFTPVFMADSYWTAVASAVSNKLVFPAINSTAILMSFCIPQINIHLMDSFRVSSCAAFSTSVAYLVLSFLNTPYHAVLHRSRKSFELSVCLCCSAAISLNFWVSLTTLSNRSEEWLHQFPVCCCVRILVLEQERPMECLLPQRLHDDHCRLRISQPLNLV
jgi:hypothetical protein